ncbi:double-strand break repair protein AddB [Pseudohalocynthiibacter aestuariivivens]|uniref:Double-strand break repair protein AddB n=1 Tax=Pseudohalocynthiibacter aestuariivivens TaxID=1591409 RepID=A0ABV5JK21_9RHOB|nr:double-strand break repair protein AddB [Pseudohalocynthiibacter aestuariivivens]MBS9717676.1 double-strand break repair protein AddB [Pseudohalocynthiibacter aestuariivivens]
MFDPCEKARIFGLPPGADFAKALVHGLLDRTQGMPPENVARVEVFVNTRRMQRRVRDLFDSGPALLLPRLRLVTDLGQDAAMADLPPAVPPLRRRLELSQLVAQLLKQQPDLAPRSAVFDLADSLAALMDEMQGEGVSPEKIAELDVTDQSGHWERALKFVSLIQRFFQDEFEKAPDSEARQRMVIERLVSRWADSPPDHPVIVAGSTGSRGATHLLMQAVARLPQGALVLPGFDFDMPASVWTSLDNALTTEDHPQYRFAKLMNSLDLGPGDVLKWSDTPVPSPPRNRLVSLALRPAPVTDQWMTEGRTLTDVGKSTESISLIEAPSSRLEAVAIALRLRKAAEDGETAALISPDRQLTRQVTAALDQWRIEPDDSAGRPLHLSAPGRFLRHVSNLFGQKLTSESLLTLLKHPLSYTGAENRGLHLLWTRELELSLRRYGPPFPTPADLTGWAELRADDGRLDWTKWLGEMLGGLEQVSERPLSDHLRHHLQIAEQLAAGPVVEGAGTLWDKPAGKAALAAVQELEREASAGGILSPADYNALFLAILKRVEVRDPSRPHSNIMIWGTLEARVQGADLVILGGLNDGVWPEQPAPDPWLNRKMRQDAGLLLPERRIGLSAHDFQQAIAAKEVWLTRAIRDAEAETVPSRWVNRLVNLLNGLTEQGGKEAYSDMEQRGQFWLDMAEALSTPKVSVPAENRPSPYPPTNQRPRKLSVTRIKTLIRDPYAVYAQYVLRLKPLDPIKQTPDAPLRGTVLHKVMEQFLSKSASTREELLHIADQVLLEDAPWPAARRIWWAKLARVADWFIAGEQARRAISTPIKTELLGSVSLAEQGFTLTAKADRFDRAADGSVYIIDYKTGAPPSAEEQTYFDKQLLLEAAMVERGGFSEIGSAHVAGATYIGLGSSPKEVHAPLDDPGLDQVWQEFDALIRAYSGPKQGYTSRRAMAKMRFGGDFDHLARFGEWDETQEPAPKEMP